MNKVKKPGKKSFGVSGALIGLILLCIVFTILAPSFLGAYNLMNIIRQCAINLVLAVGMTCVILTGGIDLSVGGVLALSGTLTAGLMAGGMGIVPAVLVGLLIGIAFGAFNGICVALGNIPPFITTMATLSISRAIALIYTGGYPVSNLPKKFCFIGTGTIGFLPTPVIIAAIFFIGGVFVLKKTILGRYIYAIGGNIDAARLSGINVRLWTIVTYAIHGFLCAVGGLVLTARMNSGQPTAGTGIELDVIAAVVIGGTSLSGGEGGLMGTLIGALIITVLNTGLTLIDVNPYLQGLIIGIVILVSVFMDRKQKEKA